MAGVWLHCMPTVLLRPSYGFPVHGVLVCVCFFFFFFFFFNQDVLAIVVTQFIVLFLTYLFSNYFLLLSPQFDFLYLFRGKINGKM